MKQLYATGSMDHNLPPPRPTAPAIFSVPRPSGGFDYYEAPAGSVPATNDDWPLPVIAHPNPIGVAATMVGRPLPRGSRHVGSGSQARGSVTAMPGARGPGQGGNITGLGELDEKGVPPFMLFMLAMGASVIVVAGVMAMSKARGR